MNTVKINLHDQKLLLFTKIVTFEKKNVTFFKTKVVTFYQKRVIFEKKNFKKNNTK